MDPVLPFRALSPGNRNQKISQQRNRDTKLSLKTRKGNTVGHDGKENRAPITERYFKKPIFKLSDSDLLTSDESDSSMIDVGAELKKHSVMSLNTQESTFSIPVAESTRCELPTRNQNECVESTVISLHTAQNGSSSSSGTEYFTACPFPVGCDESIVCISDSSPESFRKNGKKTKIGASVLLTSDESDSETYPKSNIFSSIGKCEKKKLCDTVIIETSEEEDNCSTSAGDYNNCDIIIPPSVKSDRSLSSSSISSTRSLKRLQGGHVIPPSPEKCEESSENESLISEDDCKNGNMHKINCSPGRTKPGFSEPRKQQCDDYFPKVRVEAKECSKEPDLTASSWKDDFHLVMEESTVSNKERSKCSDEGIKANALSKATSSISKEKYNDIARWLTAGRNSESDLDDSTSCEKRSPKKKVDNLTPDTCQNTHQKSRLIAARRSSSGSESDDNFEALMASIRKKTNTAKKEIAPRKNSFQNGSFIDDEAASDVVESPSFNVYHSDLTRSIRAEVKSVKKSVKSMTKRQIFGHEDKIGENHHSCVGETQKRQVSKNMDSFMKVRPLKLDSDESSSDKSMKKGTESDTSSYDFVPPPTRGKVAVNRKTKHKKSVKRFNSVESSDSDDSNPDEPMKPKATNRRNKRVVSGSGSGSTSSSKSDLPKSKLKDTPKLTSNIPKSTQPFKTPKNVAALKSPQTPYSPIRTFLSSLSGPTHQPGVRDHPEAVIYSKNFKGKKEELTRRLFKLFNREVFDRRLPDDMVLEWNARLVRTAGLCYCKLVRKGGVTSRTTKIDLSTKVITSPDRLRDTLIHEMCHAAVWLLNNVSGGHGPFWKAWAHKAMKRFPELPPIERCHSYKIETKFTYRCTKCGYSFGRHSKSLDLDKKRCGYCYGTFEVFLSSKGPNTKEKDSETPKAPKAPSGFALFVKENYGLIKQDHSDFKHGDIMKKLGEKFAQMKVKQSTS
ncbi:germ cell nuclear acidic protein-like isoform X2 [Frankliniella occidentalis]|uniref:Germ cell nuclear acidic protein-like isoform X2 n=1 Tax=Frankliniella occidentalis TaxID=133901 RepID=A0A9C6UES0_FRAOC|nr:germ cell nuclear acidic protein-like isoform X2 [Frankliniella occidentalis]